MYNIFDTKILPKAGKIASNDYVVGRIMGVNYVICNGVPGKGYGMIMNDDGSNFFRTVCTADQYTAFAKIVEELYPGLCIFDYKE